MSFSWQSVSKTIIYVSFANNQKNLAKTVCVNKNKPKSCCQAKCYLEKQIKKEDNRQSNLPSGLKDKTETTELLSDSFKFDFFYQKSKENPFVDLAVVELKGFLKQIDQPPNKELFL
jgi:cell division protein FtsX